jgi:hypothetical protein
MEYTEEQIDVAWKRGLVVPGVDPDRYRKDVFGAWIRKCRFGESKLALSFGWSVVRGADLPDRLPGEEDLLFPLQWQNAHAVTHSKGNLQVTAEGFYNNYKKRTIPCSPDSLSKNTDENR